MELVFKLKRKTQDCVIAVLDRLERKLGSKRFREVFKSITLDNGCENLDMAGMEKSLFTKQSRTRIYYAHPYSAYERGSNEVGNCLLMKQAASVNGFLVGATIHVANCPGGHALRLHLVKRIQFVVYLLVGTANM